jgi:hypothetical protein
MSPFHQYWSRWMELASQAPEEVARRVDLMTRAPGSSLSLADSQRVMFENWATASEAWWSWWKAAHAMHWPSMPWPPAGVVPPPEAPPPAEAPAPVVRKTRPPAEATGGSPPAARKAGKAHAKHARHR